MHPAPGQSPTLSPHELTGKTRTQIRELARNKGLTPTGNPDAADGSPRKWKDPVTDEEQLRLDRGHIDPQTGRPYNNPNAVVDHVHGYASGGAKIRDPVTNDHHFPTTGS